MDYLIRTVAGQDWPAFRKERWANVLKPAGFGCEPCAGWGDFRMQCGGVEISFTTEPPGWQVEVEGVLEKDLVSLMMDTIANQIGAEIHEACEWIEL